MYWFPLHSWRTYSLNIEFWVDKYFLPALEKCVLLPSGIHVSGKKYVVFQTVISLQVSCHYFLTAFKIFPFFSFHNIFIMMSLTVDFRFILFEIYSASWVYKLYLSTNLWDLGHYFLKCLFSPILFLFSLQDSNEANVTLLFLSCRSKALFIFLHCFHTVI